MKIFIVNLQSSVDRRERMKFLLAEKGITDYEFIEAVDGRKMSEEEQEHVFDQKKAFQWYGRICRPGEIGCTLSHQKCYRKMVDEGIDVALILEDDIEIRLNDLQDRLLNLKCLLEFSSPLVLLLSGGYWYKSFENYKSAGRIATVYDAYYTHAYMINLEAARSIIEQYPFILADDWKFIRDKGVKLRACLPHLIDQQEVLASGIYENNENRGMNKMNMPLIHRIHMYWIGGVKKILAYLGRFENC